MKASCLSRREGILGGLVVGFSCLGSGQNVTFKGAKAPTNACKRLSCVKGDPGEIAYALAAKHRRKIRVFLDGVEQDHVSTADEAEGLIVKAAVDSADDNVLVNCATGRVVEEVLRGSVRIEIGEEGSASA